MFCSGCLGSTCLRMLSRILLPALLLLLRRLSCTCLCMLGRILIPELLLLISAIWVARACAC